MHVQNVCTKVWMVVNNRGFSWIVIGILKSRWQIAFQDLVKLWVKNSYVCRIFNIKDLLNEVNKGFIIWLCVGSQFVCEFVF